MKESAVEAKLVRLVKAHGGLCLKWVSPGHVGVPDRIVILPGGRVYFVELKTAEGRLSPAQVVCHKELRKRGAEVVTLRGADEVARFVEEVCREV